MTTATVTRTRALLHRAPNDDPRDGQCFRLLREELPGSYRSVYIDHATWDDLGRPDSITVAIQPGNHPHA